MELNIVLQATEYMHTTCTNASWNTYDTQYNTVIIPIFNTFE
jgi:hypothetical protein